MGNTFKAVGSFQVLSISRLVCFFCFVERKMPPKEAKKSGVKRGSREALSLSDEQLCKVAEQVAEQLQGLQRSASISNIKSEMRSFKSNENIHKKEGESYYVVSANKASSVTL